MHFGKMLEEGEADFLFKEIENLRYLYLHFFGYFCCYYFQVGYLS